MQDESNLVKFFGNTPFIKLVDAFIDNIGQDYSKKDIQELAGISKATLFNHWSKLAELGIIKETRSFGKTKLYKLNKDNPSVKDLLRIELDMIEATRPKEKILAKVRA